MKTAIVYALVSSAADIYLEQAFISMFSAKRCSPGARIVVCVDDATRASLTPDRQHLLRYADEVVTVPGIDPALDSRVRSRIVKISTRQHVDGPIIAIDVDTLVVRPLNDLDCAEADIMACRDSHSPFATSPYRQLCLDQGHELDWPIDDEETYFNGGVIFSRDCPLSRELYDRWLQNYLRIHERTLGMDQPALAFTNYEMGHVIKPLPDVYNVQFKHGIRYLPEAKIVHYLTTNSFGHQPFLLNEIEVMRQVKRTGEVPPEVVATIDNPFMGIPEVSFMVSIDMLHDIMYPPPPPPQPTLRRLLRRRIRRILQWPLRVTGLYDIIHARRNPDK